MGLNYGTIRMSHSSSHKLHNLFPRKLSLYKFFYIALPVAVISSTLVFAIGLILFIAGLYTTSTILSSIGDISSKKMLNSAGTVPLSTNNSSGVAPELTIASNGSVFARNAEVTSISSDNTLSIVMLWGDTHYPLIVQTDKNTNFFDTKGARDDPQTIHTGDTVTITGVLINSSPTPTIQANFVRIVQ